jgi:YD repeat-containing protein
MDEHRRLGVKKRGHEAIRLERDFFGQVVEQRATASSHSVVSAE